ncbi:NADPH:adrenodoxin oxidoreductase, mitochondrial isoform X2 [Rhodnius prolixus]|uniref:NADPH:adrenodoxin oxidoreductase, mitochondrial isoform X2 n=1 Tax=Rhodnius prolixus TaxID=13249 RepID=UPI003D187AAA
MFKSILIRGLCSLPNFSPKQVCIIGGGPAGFYFAQHILKAIPNVQVDMYEKLPVPFGLVRYGVAPDHPEVKNVISTFTKTASHPNFQFVGNVTMGKDIPFTEFCNSYHAVVLAYGCSEDCELGIKGEKLNNLISARCFVGWYNGLPDNKNLEVDLSSDSVSILGQGNVAMDVARILLTPVDVLKKTDISAHALDTLSSSNIRNAYLVGRRGPLQVAFTTKEFREMTKLPGVRTEFRSEQLKDIQQYVAELPRARKRLTELILKTQSTEQVGDKMFQPLFYRKPVAILGNASVSGVKFSINKIVNHKEGTVVSTDKFEEILCGLVLRSIGYKGICPDSNVPFDEKTGRIKDCPGVYSTGWINSGPVGVILSTMNNAYKQAAILTQDIASNRLDTSITKSGYTQIKALLNKKGLVTVSFDGWKKIDRVEVERGKAVGKPREKIVSIQEMLKIGGQTP